MNVLGNAPDATSIILFKSYSVADRLRYDAGMYTISEDWFSVATGTVG